MAVAIAKRRDGRAHIVTAWDRPDGATELVCFGPKRHFRKDGTCRCVAAVLASLTDAQRAAVVVVPFGGAERKREGG